MIWHALFGLDVLLFAYSCLGILFLSVHAVFVRLENAWSIVLVPTSSASVELFVLNICLHEAVYVAPFSSVMYIPAWLLISRCMVYELSAHYFDLSPGSTVSISVFVFLKY